jgi:poly(A) polymerase
MPVITPAYPSMCATFNITRSSMTVIQRELKRALQLSEKILSGKRPWSDLFVKHTFFTAGYKYYICVVSASKSKETHKIWSGYVESKVRMLVQRIETHPSIALAHAFNKGYERRHRCHSDDEIIQVQEGSIQYIYTGTDELPSSEVKEEETTSSETIQNQADAPTNKAEDGSTIKSENGIALQANGVDHAPEGTGASNTGGNTTDATNPPPPTATDIYTTTHYIGLELVENAKSLDLSFQVNEFKAICTSWQKYKDELKDVASIGVRHVKCFDLPDDVFEPGEVKPQKKARVKNTQNGKKREASEDQPPPAKRQHASVAAVG